MKERTRKILSYLIERGKEPSTWRGVALLLAVAGAQMKPEWAEAILFVGLSLSGLLGALLPDAKKGE